MVSILFLFIHLNKEQSRTKKNMHVHTMVNCGHLTLPSTRASINWNQLMCSINSGSRLMRGTQFAYLSLLCCFSFQSLVLEMKEGDRQRGGRFFTRTQGSIRRHVLEKQDIRSPWVRQHLLCDLECREILSQPCQLSEELFTLQCWSHLLQKIQVLVLLEHPFFKFLI